MEGSDIDWERLDRYVSGQGTPDEIDALERWVSADPELRKLADAMRAVGRRPGSLPRAWDVRVAWQRVHRRMRWAGRTPLHLTPPGAGKTSVRHVAARGWRRASTWYALGAAAVVVAAVSSLLITRSARTPAPRAVASATAMREIVTKRGERAVLDLLDGSRVVLAAESRLRIPATYNMPSKDGARDLHLEGEAYFKVRHDSTRPFRVRAATGIAEDLGTEFIVTAYPETRGMQVVVASGVVALHQIAARVQRANGNAADPRPLLTLTRGDLARLDSAGTAILTRGVDLASHMAWTEGSLVFNGTRLREAVPRLARWYDVDLVLADSALADRRLTATFRDESVSQVLKLMALSLDLRVERDGRSVALFPLRGSRRSQ